MDSVLRPRDIQARVRAGETPETVAAAAGTTVDKIMGFAAPALAERAYIAEQALKSSVRRRTGDGPVRHLADAVAERLSAASVDPGSVEWDAWRREDGKWTVVAQYGAGASTGRAEFVFDAAGRYVVADDDDSRRLIGERMAGEPQLALGDDAIAVVTGKPASRLRSVPARTESVAEPSDWMVTQASERPATAQAPAQAPAPEPGAQAADVLFDTAGLREPQQPAPPAQPAAQPAARRSRGRASVPSWDEIMFGSTGAKE